MVEYPRDPQDLTINRPVGDICVCQTSGEVVGNHTAPFRYVSGGGFDGVRLLRSFLLGLSSLTFVGIVAADACEGLEDQHVTGKLR